MKQEKGMSETEYLQATNRVKVSMACMILSDVLPGKNCGITDSELRKIMVLLKRAEEKLFNSILKTEENKP